MYNSIYTIYLLSFNTIHNILTKWVIVGTDLD